MVWTLLMAQTKYLIDIKSLPIPHKIFRTITFFISGFASATSDHSTLRFKLTVSSWHLKYLGLFLYETTLFT